MDRQLLRLTISVAVFSAGIFLILLWQPSRQVRLHQAHLLRALEKRNFSRFAEFIAENYSDRWGHDKGFVVSRSSEVFRHFVFSKIQQQETALQMRPGAGVLSSQITITGTGSPVADYVKTRVEDLTEPFTFEWQKRSWKPWDWQLTEVNQPQLEITGFE